MTDRHSKNADVQVFWIGVIVFVAVCAFLFWAWEGATQIACAIAPCANGPHGSAPCSLR